MKRVLFLVVTTLGVCLASGSYAGRGDRLAEIRREVERVYSAWDAYVEAGRVEELVKMIDPSFYAIDTEGNRTHYSEAVRMLKEMLSSAGKPGSKMKDLRSRIKVEAIYLQGDEVVAWVTLKASAKVKENGQWKVQTFEAKFAETLKKFGKTWRFVCSQMLP